METTARGIRILHVAPAFYPATYWGGPVYSVFGLCNALAAIPSVDLRVLTTDTAGPRLHDRVQVTSFPMRFRSYDVFFCRRQWGASVSLGMILRLWPMIRWADAVHVTGVYSPATIPTLLICRLLGKPLVWSSRGALQRWGGTSHPWAKRVWEHVCDALLVRRRSVLHVTSEEEGQESVLRILRAEIACIPNGIDLPTLPAQRVWKPEGRLRLLYIGRLDPKKGIENLLAALAQILDVKTELAICGRGASDYEEGLHKVVGELGLSARVHFLGQVNGAEKNRAFFEADLCVVPSFTENFGMVVAEALAHGVPVVASRGTPWAEVERRGCGLWVDNAPDDLKRAILRMNEVELREMGTRGRIWMEEEFPWERIALRMEAVYRRLVGGRP